MHWLGDGGKRARFFQMNVQNKAKELRIVDLFKIVQYSLFDKSVLLNKDVYPSLISPIIHLRYPSNFAKHCFQFLLDNCSNPGEMRSLDGWIDGSLDRWISRSVDH